MERRSALLALLLTGCAVAPKTEVKRQGLPVLERLDVLMYPGLFQIGSGSGVQVQSAAHLLALQDYFPGILRKNGLRVEEYYFTTQNFLNSLIRMSETKSDPRYLLVVQGEKLAIQGQQSTVHFMARLIDRVERGTVWTASFQQNIFSNRPRKQAALMARDVLIALEQDRVVRAMPNGPVDLSGQPIRTGTVFDKDD